MKQIFLLSFAALASVSTFSQNSNGNAVVPWRMGGNSAGSSDFLGTTNQQSLIFKTNNTEAMRIDPTGKIIFSQLGSTSGDGIVVVGGGGEGGRVDFTHNFSHVLNGQGIFTEISVFTGFTVNGNNIIQTASGNIGIGVSNPVDKISVSGNGRFTGNLNIGGNILSNALQTNTLTAGHVTAGFLSSNTMLTANLSVSGLAGGSGLSEVYVDQYGNFKLGGGGGGNSQTPLFCAPNSLNWTLGGNNISSFIQNGDHPAAGTCDNNDFILKANNNQYVWLKTDGRLGIGTGTPSTMLDIQTGGTKDAFKIWNGTTSIFSVNVNGSTTINDLDPVQLNPLLTMTHSNGSTLKLLANGSGDIASSASISMHFGTVNQADNFAIYQGAPGNGIQHFFMNRTGSSFFRTTDPNANGTAFMVVNNPNSSGTGVNTEVVTIKNNGSTVIGYNANSNASYTDNKMLTVNGDATFANYNSSGVSTDGFYGIEVLGADKVPVRRGISTDNNPDGDVNFFINGYQTSGNVGIPEFNFKNGIDNLTSSQATAGTSAPSLMSVGAKGTVNIFNLDGSSSPLVVHNTNLSQNTIFEIGSLGTMTLNTNVPVGQNVFDVVDRTNNGKVNFRIKQNGQVYAREVIVMAALNNFPDYVFAKDYKLMPLEEVKKFTETNKHLPNMPTALDVEKNGANLGEIQRVSVEKIEELYKYIFEMEAQIKSLKEELNKMKSK